jgi:2-oxoglutarate ferredoxin oxidoreductase subunit gamma
MTEKTLFAGFGGQGVISLGQIWVYCGMKEGKNVTFFPFYGAEKRGGIARAGVVVSDEEIASPLVSTADSAVVLNQDSLAVCEASLKKDGLID